MKCGNYNPENIRCNKTATVVLTRVKRGYKAPPRVLCDECLAQIKLHPSDAVRVRRIAA